VSTTQIILAIAGWGFLALFLLALLSARGRDRVFKPVLRDQAPSVACRRCRLPFLRASWRCGRCHAFMKPGLIFIIGRGIVEPLLALLIVPWIIVVGILLSISIWLTSLLLPRFQGVPEKCANRLGSWAAPMFRRWVPLKWRVYSSGTLIGPSEVDTPIETLADAAMILAASLLQSEEGEVEVHVVHPTEETLDTLRHTRTGIQEMWGYVSDGHVFFPTYVDQIVGARFHGEDLTGYVEGITSHLLEPHQRLEVKVKEKFGENDERSASPLMFRLRRDLDQKGKYPVTWEIDASSETLLRIKRLIETMEAWDTLPCQLTFH